ncbi:MAG TPA: hypothetical protein PLX99_12945, partial [Gammaproteobacteria bacterium]|nr:hypothetical protein [Gammaproteobacteria bacterium]
AAPIAATTGLRLFFDIFSFSSRVKKNWAVFGSPVCYCRHALVAIGFVSWQQGFVVFVPVTASSPGFDA